MSNTIDFTNPSVSELSEQDTAFLAWLKDTSQEELSTKMLKAMGDVDKSLFKKCF